VPGNLLDEFEQGAITSLIISPTGDHAQQILRSAIKKLVAHVNATAEVTIVDIRGEKVRIGLNFPKATPVHRKEVADDIRRQKQEKAAAAKV